MVDGYLKDSQDSCSYVVKIRNGWGTLRTLKFIGPKGKWVVGDEIDLCGRKVQEIVREHHKKEEARVNITKINNQKKN